MSDRPELPTIVRATAAAATPADAPGWHRLPVPEVLARLDSAPHGLAEAEAAARLARHGPNRLTPPRPVSALQRFLRQFTNPLIAVLIPAALVMAALGDLVDAAVVAGVVLINALIGFIQEGRAEQALAAIRDMLSPQAGVVRGGQRHTIPAEHLVPGDVVWLASGDRVPADLRVLQAKGLEVQEAALTGESLAVAKHSAPAAADAALGERHSILHSGTLVARGQGQGVVVATGDRTELGRIGRLLADTQSGETPLIRQIGLFGRWLTIAILALGAATFGVGVLVRGFSVAEMFAAAVGLAVAAIPEGLPAILTITLAIGVTRMARRNAIIRRLPAVETLGAVSVICTDKTGTLTRNEMAVRTAVTAGGRFQVSGDGYDPAGRVTGPGAGGDALLRDLARAVLLCNDAALDHGAEGWRVEGDAVDGALLAFAARAGLDRVAETARHRRLDGIPFESDRAYMATLNRAPDGEAMAYVKGAPETLLARAAAVLTPDGARPLDRDAWRRSMDALAAEGQRLLAVACKPLPGAETLVPGDVEDGLLLLGLVGLIDPPRAEVPAAVAECGRAGIAVKMITGDHGVTARAIGAQIGLQAGLQAGLQGGVITGPALDRLDGDGFDRAACDHAVFARATPEHKIRLVEALRRAGHIVAMTGDGVNDAPALKRADVGIAMGAKGTEAAKEAGDMVLADDNFATIVHAVEEGRTVFDNLRKALIYVLPTSFGEAGTIVVAVLLGMAMPITATQILWVNMVTAVTLSLSLAFDPADRDLMDRPPRPRDVPLLSGFLVWRIAFVTMLMVAGCAFIFADALAAGRPEATARTLVVNALVLFEVAYLFNCRVLVAAAFTRAALFGNPIALWAVLAVLAAQLLLTYAPPMQALFATTPLTGADWLRLTLLAVLLFLLVEGEKGLRRRLG
ncbi:cation-translocating P-type ATPase [Oleisolibacter albus]|uniref:cation-translocating P-type ATPase n=1 Tax=Oleisolibacter albus TaxID=2171757 RepID=UPI000DF14904|nr:HAD-IC family P-type ATPase [Oleisolibacter albus]